MELGVLDYKGNETGRKVDLSSDVYGVEPNEHSVYLDVKQYLANQRQGTHKSKERGEIVGSTKKLKKQKGTGTARAGSIKSPIFRGGGRIFGPRPRNYSFKLNRKLKDLARKSVLSVKASKNALLVVEDFTFDGPKTSQYLQFLSDCKLEGVKSLYLMAEDNEAVYLSSRNIPGAKVRVVDTLNTYDLLNADRVVISEKSVGRINEILSK